MDSIIDTTNDDSEIDKSIVDDIGLQSIFSLVYTSGTTGLPKAAIVKQKRVYLGSYSFYLSFGLRHSDKLYCVLPLYHSSAGLLGVGMMINGGVTLVLRSKFSKSAFFKDCVDYKVTVIQYIGELCRYLLLADETEYDTKHNIRLAFGNGLRADVWKDFTKRFNVKRISEFYAATEGNVLFINNWKEGDIIGPMGKGGFLNRATLGYTFVKYDVEKDELIRDQNGCCIKCKKGEPGELITRVAGASDFPGYYKNEKDTEAKMIYSPFGKGSGKWARSGDLITRDKYSNIWFTDRIGDTFRWKGENVSTGEVTNLLSETPDVESIQVVGVELPKHEGRACMAVVQLRSGIEILDFDSFTSISKKNLPKYAQPLFVRLIKQVDMTGTFKPSKTTYKKQGISVECKDPIYYMNAKTNKFERLTDETRTLIENGSLKF